MGFERHETLGFDYRPRPIVAVVNVEQCRWQKGNQGRDSRDYRGWDRAGNEESHRGQQRDADGEQERNIAAFCPGKQSGSQNCGPGLTNTPNASCP